MKLFSFISKNFSNVWQSADNQSTKWNLQLEIKEFFELSMLVGISEAIRLLSIFTIYIKNLFILFKNSLFLYTSSLKDIGDKENRSVKVNDKKTYGKDERFYEWLAGVIDGDGCFLLSKKGYASLEITTQLRDKKMLYLIKQVLVDQLNFIVVTTIWDIDYTIKKV